MTCYTKSNLQNLCNSNVEAYLHPKFEDIYNSQLNVVITIEARHFLLTCEHSEYEPSYGFSRVNK